MKTGRKRADENSLFLFLPFLILVCLAIPARAEVEKIDCSQSRLVAKDFTGLTCETVQNAPGTDYYIGQFDYYGIFGEQGHVFLNLELAIAGLRSYVDPALQLPLKEHFENRFYWVAEAENWSEVQKAGRLSYLTFEIDYGNCIGFYLYEGPQFEGYKHALNGIYCHKEKRTISLRDLQGYLETLSFE